VESYIIIPAIRGTLSILESALKVKSIHRVVITSSAVAVATPEQLSQGTSSTLVTANTRVTPLPEAPWGPPLMAYRKSKVLALNAIEKFMAEKKPHFTLINVMPSYVIGPHELLNDISMVTHGSNQIIMSVALGTTPLAPGARPGSVISVGDVARVHIKTLNEEKIPGNKSFLLLAPERVVFDDVKDIARKHFPKAVEDGTLPLNGTVPTARFETDVSAELGLFGPFKPFEEMVVGLLERYLTLKVRN
jgi:nucleoside-diphosphate-sugar epimerase